MTFGVLQAVLALGEFLLRLAAPLAAWFAGREKARSERLSQSLDHARQANAIDEEVARLDDAALRRELLAKRG